MSITPTTQGQKLPLSGAPAGNLRKLIDQTSGTTCVLHTGPTDSTGLTFDELFLLAVNTDTARHTLTIQWGGTAVKDSIPFVLEAGEIRWLEVSGIPLQGQSSPVAVSAICDSTTKVSVGGYANRLA